jgi:hypothetical protein
MEMMRLPMMTEQNRQNSAGDGAIEVHMYECALTENENEQLHHHHHRS